MIQPNPDSALNATAGHLLQDDYDSFARQARLMTSIHAGIPTDLKGAALAAKRRGEEPATNIVEDAESRPMMKVKSASSSGVLMKKVPHRITSTQPAAVPPDSTYSDENSTSAEEDETSASKENDLMLSPSPVLPQSPGRPSMLKRPLSDISTIVGPQSDPIGGSGMSPSDQNILNNTLTVIVDPLSQEQCEVPERTGQSRAVTSTSRGLQDTSANSSTALPIQQRASHDGCRPTKRVCSDGSKENIFGDRHVDWLPESSLPAVSSTSKVSTCKSLGTSAPNALGVGSAKGKARIGLRRL